MFMFMLVFCSMYICIYILLTIISYCYLYSYIGICLVLCDHFHLHIIINIQHLFHTLYVYLWEGGEGGGINMFLGGVVMVGVWLFCGGGGWGPAQNAHSGIERECVLNAALRHNIVQICTHVDLLAISEHALLLHHR